MTMPSREGQRFGNYRLHRLLGKGAFAEVYLGEHLYLRNYAALKLLHASLTERDEQLFLSEAQTIAQLAHPNIVRVREFAIERSTPFLVMDYVPGGTLRHRHPRGTCLSLEQTIHYVKQIAAALQYAHNHGIIHRDVKPENVLQGSEQVILSDFGISVHAPKPDMVRSQEWAGTLPYMAPEQFQGQAVFASDQYTLAILAYEWLCSVRPFEGSSTALIYQHGNVPPPRLRGKDPSLPEAVETVILKALSKKPEERYVSILSFARALERANQNPSYEIQPNADTESADAPSSTRSRRVFLSHASLDTPTRLQTDLTIRDISVQDDVASELQEEKMRQAIRAAQMVLLVLTPHTRSSAAVKEHLRIANLYRRSLICVWVEGDDLRELLPAGTEQSIILDARGPRYQQALDEIMTFLDREYRSVSSAGTPLPDLDFEPRNPYKGLRAFTPNDRADFFGRESIVQELLDLLKRMVNSPQIKEPEPRFLAVVGPSGSGKSSVVMAGLLPKLQDGVLLGSEEWIYLDSMVPGKQPLESLMQVLAARFPEKAPQAGREVLMKEGGFGLHQLGLALVKRPETHVVLIIDQFEELFSSDIPEQERLHFIRLLVTAATEPRGPVIILLTLRADFYDRPFAYPELGRLVQQQQCAILPMGVEDLREVIERPAFLPDVRLMFDEDLVGDLLFDLRDQIGALPLLEFALDQLFAHRRDRRLTRYAYQEIGGVRGALSRHAESSYTALPSEEHRRLARMLFVRLVQFGAEEQEPLRRRADASEFALENAEQTRLLREVIDAFLTARLITVNQFATTSTLEISHEALIREWPRLATWVREAREDMHLQQTLSNDVRDWERRGKTKDRLYHGSQLKESLAWRRRNTTSGSEAAFLRASATRRQRARISSVLVALLLLAILIPAGVLLQQQFAPLSVTTLKDDMPGSLRQTIANARSGSTITIDPGLKGTLILSRGLVINKNLTLRGSNVDQLVIRGTRDLDGLIQVQSHATVTFSLLTFNDPTPAPGPMIRNYGRLTLDRCHVTGNIQQGVTISSGNVGFGGAILNYGTLILQRSIIAHNTVTGGNSFGGGISTDGGTLDIQHSQIVDNMAIASGQFASGGGIYSINSQVTLSSSIVARNKATGQSIGAGGGIYSYRSRLTLNNSTLSENSAEGRGQGGYGGGIADIGGTITINSSRLLGNTVTSSITAAGGAIYSENLISSNKVVSAGIVSITNSLLSNNIVTGNSQTRGGGIAVTSGSLTLTRTTVVHNMLTSQQRLAGGGGIFSGDTLTVTDSVVSSNSVTAPTNQYGAIGGGIDTAGILNLTRTTISLNTVNSAQGVAGGGGIYADRPLIANPRLSLTNCTIANNQALGANGVGGGFATDMLPTSGTIDFCTIFGNIASTRAGGIDADQANIPKTSLLFLKNSIVAGNVAGIAPDISGAFITGGYNLVQRFTGAIVNDSIHMHKTDISGDRFTNLGIDTQLRQNGGSTPTLALQPDSPAINVIPATACDVTTDQRGIKRPQHNACDIGSYEYS